MGQQPVDSMQQTINTSATELSAAPEPTPVPSKEDALKEDQVSSLPELCSSEPATGTRGNAIGVPHTPLVDGAAIPAEPATRLLSDEPRLISAALVQGPRSPASDRAVSRTWRARTPAHNTVAGSGFSFNFMICNKYRRHRPPASDRAVSHPVG